MLDMLEKNFSSKVYISTEDIDFYENLKYSNVTKLETLMHSIILSVLVSMAGLAIDRETF